MRYGQFGLTRPALVTLLGAWEAPTSRLRQVEVILRRSSRLARRRDAAVSIVLVAAIGIDFDVGDGGDEARIY